MSKLARRLAPFLLAALVPLAALADEPGKHPYYLHALSNLRAARWLIERRPGDAAVSADEDVAIHEIDATIGNIRRAAIDDGKDIHDHAAADERLARGRLHPAEELLHKVRRDLTREEDDPLTRGLRNRALHHLDEAMRATRQAIQAVESGR